MNIVTKKIIETLNTNSISYDLLEHAPVRTSEEAANLYERQKLGVGKKQGAKALLLKVRERNNVDRVIMFVLPGDEKMNTNMIKKALNIKSISFLDESEVTIVLPGVMPGGVPPFGNLFNIETYGDSKIMSNEKIAFNVGDKSISIVMGSKDWEKITKPNFIY